jgi:hypothetical protein
MPEVLELLATRTEPQGQAELLLATAGSVAAVGELLAGAHWASRVPGRGGFGLLLVWDGEPPEFADIAALARELIGSGMFYFGAWGQDCARVEYAVDIADVMLSLDAEPAEGSDEAPIVMTSAFPDGSVADALFQLWEMAPRDDGKAWGPARVVVALSPAPALAAAVRAAVSAAGGAG